MEAVSLPAAPTTEELVQAVKAHFDEHKPEPASFPVMASKIIDTAEHPDVDAAKLAHLIERDPAICAAVLAMANSSANRPRVPVTSVRQAVARLGLKDVTNIAVGIACKSLFDVEVKVQHELFPGWWERLFHSAMTEAFTCAFASMQLKPGSSEGIFLTGLLHDVGKSLGLRSLASLIVAGQLPPVQDDDAIEEVLDRNNAQIGAVALERFNMPVELVELVRNQNAERILQADADAHIVRVVSCLNTLRLGTLETDLPLNLLQRSAHALGLNKQGVFDFAKQLSEHSAQVGVLFSTSDDSDETGFFEFIERCLVL